MIKNENVAFVPEHEPTQRKNKRVSHLLNYLVKSIWQLMKIFQRLYHQRLIMEISYAFQQIDQFDIIHFHVLKIIKKKIEKGE